MFFLSTPSQPRVKPARRSTLHGFSFNQLKLICNYRDGERIDQERNKYKRSQSATRAEEEVEEEAVASPAVQLHLEIKFIFN